jgi:hypothetical protein
MDDDDDNDDDNASVSDRSSRGNSSIKQTIGIRWDYRVISRFCFKKKIIYFFFVFFKDESYRKKNKRNKSILLS